MQEEGLRGRDAVAISILERRLLSEVERKKFVRQTMAEQATRMSLVL